MPPAQPDRRQQRISGSLLFAGVAAVCLMMAALQLWRAETRGERFVREREAASQAAVTLSAAQRDRDSLVDRPAVMRGRWLAEKTLFLDNKIYRSRPGYEVLTPLELVGGHTVVLVNRGWVRAPKLRSEFPSVKTPSGEVEVTGVTRGFETRVFELQRLDPTDAVWQHVREDDYRRISGLDALPVIVLQTSAATDDGLVRDWARPENPATKHYGYALMWVVFALTAAGFAVVNRRREA